MGDSSPALEQVNLVCHGDKDGHPWRISATYLTKLQLPTIISLSMISRDQFPRPTALCPVLRRLTLALELLLSTLLLNLRGLLLISYPAAG